MIILIKPSLKTLNADQFMFLIQTLLKIHKNQLKTKSI